MAKSIRPGELSDVELTDEVVRARQELFELRFKLATGSLEDTAALKRWRRQIARIETELRDREIAAAEVAASKGGAS